MLSYNRIGFFLNILFVYCISFFSLPLFSCDNYNSHCALAESITLTNSQEYCLTACTDNGSSENFDLSSQGCQASPFSTVWYHVTSDDKSILTANLSSTVLDLPLIRIFKGNCTTPQLIDCNQGYANEVSLKNITLEAATDYYLTVSTIDGSIGEFDLCLTIDKDPNVCNTKPTLEIISTSEGSPMWGPYKPGEEVEICYTIDGYENLACNYLQGIVPIFGNGWDPSSFDIEGQPKIINQNLETQGHTNFTTSNPTCEGEPAGDWRWHSQGTVQYNLNSANPLGLRVRDDIPAAWVFVNSFDPACFNFNDGCCTNPDENPNLGYGDDDYPMCGTGSTQTWKICFTLTTSLSPSLDNHDCSIGMKTLADGEIGALILNACNADMISYTNASVEVIVPPIISVDQNSLQVCGGQQFNIVLNSDSPDTKYFWFVQGENEVFAATDNLLTYSFSDSGTYLLSVYGSNGSISEPVMVTVEVREELSLEIVQEPLVACAGEEVELKAVITDVSDISDIVYSWNYNNEDDNSLRVSDVDREYELQVNLGACAIRKSIEINHHDISTLTMSSQEKVCTGAIGEFNLQLEGSAPWTISLEDNEGQELLVETSDSEFLQEIQVEENMNFTLLSAVDGNNCKMEADGSWAVTTHSELEVWAGDDAYLGCGKEEVQLNGEVNIDLEKTEVQWRKGGDVIDANADLSPFVSTPGMYSLVVTDQETGCTASDIVEVLDYSSDINLELTNPLNLELESGESIFLEAHVDIDHSEVASVLWLHDGTIDCETCMSSMAYPHSDVLYEIEVIDVNGCSETERIQVTIRENQNSTSSVYIPNTFDPFSDGANSKFGIYGDISLLDEFVISDRWGNEVFSAQELDPEAAAACWDGTMNGEAVTSGVYIYMLRITMLDDSIVQRVGTITLIK